MAEKDYIEGPAGIGDDFVGTPMIFETGERQKPGNIEAEGVKRLIIEEGPSIVINAGDCEGRRDDLGNITYDTDGKSIINDDSRS